MHNLFLKTMEWIDTHAHLYLEEFAPDLQSIVDRARQNNVSKIMLPNIDLESFPRMLELSDQFPGFFYPMIGLHPCDVNANWEIELQKIKSQFSSDTFIAIGETGIDLHWDSSTLEIQKLAFKQQIQWAKDWHLPIVIHARKSTSIILDIIESEMTPDLTGIFHCFSGNEQEAERLKALNNFKVGIGGSVTYKNSELPQVLKKIPLSLIVLETDSPFLPPVPFRGKRNESAYLPLVGEAISNIYQISLDKVAEITTNNAKEIFKLA